MKVSPIALVRGNGMNSWEGRAWNDFPEEFGITGFCANKNLYPLDDLKFPIVRLKTSTDQVFLSKLNTFGGIFQRMSGLEKYLKDFSIAHTVEIYNYYTHQAVLAKKLNPNLKVVTTVWDNSPGRFDQGFFGPFKRPSILTKKIKKMIRDNALQIDRFLAVSADSAAILTDEWGVKEQKISILTPGVAERNSVNDFGENLKINEGSFLMVNRLRSEKGVYDVVLAWQIFLQKTRLKNPTLVIIGDGPERKSILKLIKDLKIENTVKYFRKLPNDAVRHLYDHARALVLASVSTPLWKEQFGYVIAEALSAGCPVIGTKSGSIPEVVGPGGIIVGENNPHELAGAMILMENGDERAKYSELAKQSSERFSMNKFKNNLVKIYTELI